jgi:hypothetical protein
LPVLINSGDSVLDHGRKGRDAAPRDPMSSARSNACRLDHADDVRDPFGPPPQPVRSAPWHWRFAETTSIRSLEGSAQHLYENVYCQRGQ